jgi:HlyD family secretion protein
MTQNVVTYTVEIVTDNSAGRLLPYLTANVKFEVSRRENVLLVPSAALRWTPSVEQVAPEHRNGPPAGQAPTSLPQGPLPTTTGPRNSNAERFGVVYVVAGQYVRPVPVKAGLSSGTHTEVEGVGLAEGMELVTGAETGAPASTDISNPFTPKLPPPPKGFPPPR